MLFNSSVLAITLAVNIVSPSTYDCIPCQQETVYMPDVPLPEMILSPEPFVREIALVPADLPEDLSFPYSPPSWSEQLPTSLEWLDELLKLPLRQPIKTGEVNVYALELDSHHEMTLVTEKKEQNYAQNKIESLKPFDKTINKRPNGQPPIKTHLI